MNIKSVNGEQPAIPMIGVALQDNGTIVYACLECDEVWGVSYALSASPFWEVFNGSAILTALAHYAEAHHQTRH
jgi:hypothetical protein